MKMAMTALAVVLASVATTASAQPGERGDGWRGRGGERSERPDRPRGDGERRDWPRRGEAPRPPEAVQPPPAPPAPEARPPRDGDWRSRGDGGGRGWERPDRDRRDGDRDRRWDDRRDNDRWGDQRYDRYPRWRRDRYAPTYQSGYRHRHAWRPPYGYYDRNWGFGDVLPRGWYGSGYWLADPWRFDLPLPPPGFDWVRVGYDALLVDQYSGRVVQVVRNVFW